MCITTTNANNIGLKIYVANVNKRKIKSHLKKESFVGNLLFSLSQAGSKIFLIPNILFENVPFLYWSINCDTV